MATGRRMVRLGLAALVAGAAAGLLAVLAIFFGAMFVGGWSWRAASAPELIAGLAAGLKAGLVLVAPPALIAGAAMRALGRRFEPARRAPAWAAAGAGGGLLLWAPVAFAVLVRVGEPGLAGPEGALLAAALGASTALAFRGVAGPGGSGVR